MKRISYRHVRLLAKANKIYFKTLFIATGIGSVLWFLIRVIPKPSRALYPCMQTIAPLMSGFVVYLLSLGGSAFAILKVRNNFRKSRYMAMTISSLVLLCFLFAFFFNQSKISFANPSLSLAIEDEPNKPMGEAKGLYPGRVSWVMNKDATNASCTNESGDYWHMDKNTNQAVVGKMLADGLMSLSGQSNSVDAWDMLIKYFNYNHSKGWTGYTKGEKIVVKLNLTNNESGGRTMSNGMNSTPQLVLALLQQLVDTLGVSQQDITIGDPFRGFSNEYWDKCYNAYPNVNYFEGKGTNGRKQTKLTANNVYFNSDDEFESRLPIAYMEAAYLINMPCLKSHGSAGITIAAKNHQGSVIGPDQNPTNQAMGAYLHYDYPDNSYNQVMGMYRHIVDFMAHEKLGGNTLVYIVDAIWSGRDWFGAVEKWKMAPFNTDWTSSLFLSQDAVAIESVGFDFLYHEYKYYASSHNNENFPLRNGVQDYIHQAADPANWPSGIKYDPSTPGHTSPVGSLGVHEHWNNATSKQYSQNLGVAGGIELVSVPSSLVANLKVNVSEVVLPGTYTITNQSYLPVTIVPDNATNKMLRWQTSDESIASIQSDGQIIPKKNGQVTITAWSVDGGKKSTSLVTISIVSSIKNISASDMIIYPNPVTDRMYVSYSLNEKANVHVEIYSLDGRLLMASEPVSQFVGNNQLEVLLNENIAGGSLYICRMVVKGAGTTLYDKKVLVQKRF